ncbi:hypothetical protein ABVT39_018758 [Epinephelus coioides]
MVVISPSDPVSIGNVVNLTCSCRGNLPLVRFGWIMITDGRPELISVNTAVYSFKVTNSDRQSEVVGAQVIVKILGIIMLVGALVIFEWWFRSRRSTKPVKVMSVITVQCVKMVTANMLLSFFFVSGALAACPEGTHPFISVPQKMEALSGSCLQIPCYITNDFIHKDGTGNVGKWIKSVPNRGIPKNVIFDSSKTVNIYPMNITGNLSERNCITLFSSLIINYTNTYYFRIENSAYKATAACDPLQIIVRDSPPRPRIEISGDLKEKESVTITCSASTPCPHSPPKLTWNLTQDPHNITEENTDQTFTTKIQKTITLSDKHDGVTITCSATYPVDGGNHKTAEERKTLNVSYAPKDTSVSISPSGLVSAGSLVNLKCSSRANPPVSSFTWFKISNDGLIKVSEGDFYSFNVICGGVYFCVATNDLGNETSSEIHLTVEDAPKDTSVSISPSGLVSAGSLVNLTCSSRANPPVSRFIWFKTSNDGPIKVSDKDLYSFNVTDGGFYYCVATNDLGNETSSEIMLIAEGTNPEFGVDVHITVKILGIVALYSTIIIFEWWFRSRCCNKPVKTNGANTFFGVWIKRDSDFVSNPNNVIFNSSKTDNTYPMNITGNLSERNCTTLFSNLKTSYTGTYYFRIENWPYRATAVCDPLQITVKDSPLSPRIEISGDLKEKESVTITCSASTPCPHSPPKLTWNLTQDPHNTIEENTDRTFTTKIQETITLSDKHDGVTITCSATYPVDGGNNKTAEERKTLNVSYAPKDTSVSISPSGLVSAGSWVNLTCSSRANPPVSSFTWFKTSNDGPIKVSEGDFLQL